MVETLTGPLAASSVFSARRLLGDGRVLTLVDQGMVSATTFLTAVVIGRACTQAEFGLYMLGLTLLLLLIEVQGSLISTPFMVEAPRLGEASRRRSAGTSLLLQLGLAAGAAFLLGGAALAAWVGVGPAGLGDVAGALALAAPFILLREHLRRLSLATFDLRALLRTDATATVCQVLVLVALLWAGAVTPGRGFLAMGVGAIAGSLFWMRGGRALRPSFSASGLRSRSDEYWRLGRWVFASGIAWASALHLFPWLLAGIQGPAAAGIWAACFGVANVANPLLLALGNWVGPAASHTFARVGASGLRKTTFRASGAVALVMVPVVAASFLWGDLLVRSIYGASFAGHGAVVGWLMVHVAVTAVGLPASRGLFTLHRADADFRANAVQLACAVVIGTLLVWRYGAMGAAFALALTSALATLLRTRSFVRVRPA